MKHQYFGDINDYRKYGLIRCLSGSGALSTTICWMLTPDTDENRDGKKISYLSHPEVWRHFDSTLFDSLQERTLNQRNERGIDEEALNKILIGVRFYPSLLKDADDLRSEYFNTLFADLPSKGLLFFDPDNGLEVPSCRKGANNSSRYLYWDEVRRAYETGNSVLIYQHFQRVERKKFINTIVEKASSETGATVFAYVTSHVVFFLLSRPEHVVHFQEANAKISQNWHTQILITPLDSYQNPILQSGCPFCNLEESRIIMANNHAIAFYDGYPITPGHCLIIPKRHIPSLFEATYEEQTAMFDLLSEMRKHILAERKPDGFNIGINDGTAAGQTVMHLHIHLIPRYTGDADDPRGGVRWIMPEKAPYWENL